jgi:diguanylate cyclase (GGDEF)-like protein
LIDLDHFKAVNDTLGHDAGDLLLQDVAARLQEALRPDDTVARLGGDEFAVLLPDTGHDGAVQVAEKIRAALAGPFTILGRCVEIGGSVGVARAPAHASEGTALLRCADVAMYAAKRSRAGHAVYAPAYDEGLIPE